MFFRRKEKKTQSIENHGIRHIAFIMDGNGRWAKKRGMPREYGHREGAKVFKELVEYCSQIGIHCVTVYAFSTENWKRPPAEVNAIMKLFSEYMSEAFRVFAEKGIRIRFIGDRSRFDADLLHSMEELERESCDNPLILNVAFNYGGRDEILHAVKTLSEENLPLTEENLGKALYTGECPDPDLVVRTGKELRISNFLLWQSAYAEYYFSDKIQKKH